MNKNNIYFNRLIDFARSLQINIFYKNNVNIGYFLPNKKEIIIDPKLTLDQQIFSILHELGHHLDDVENNYKYDDIYGKANKKVEKELSLSIREYNVLNECEIRAWKKGEIIAKLLDIRLNKGYSIFKKSCLSGYRRVKCRG